MSPPPGRRSCRPPGSLLDRYEAAAIIRRQKNASYTNQGLEKATAPWTAKGGQALADSLGKCALWLKRTIPGPGSRTAKGPLCRPTSSSSLFRERGRVAGCLAGRGCRHEFLTVDADLAGGVDAQPNRAT